MKSIIKSYLPIYILFLMSGVSAIIYQIIWQRVLYYSFGSDIDSITLIVSAFMFGLGVGSYISGYLIDSYKDKQIYFFMFIEIIIAIFGFFSYEMIIALTNILINYNNSIMFIALFIFLLIPTMLMGITFPLLVSYIYKFLKNIGLSTGELYTYNTIGAAIGAILTGCVLLFFMEIPTVILIASLNNLFVAIFVFIFIKSRGE